MLIFPGTKLNPSQSFPHPLTRANHFKMIANPPPLSGKYLLENIMNTSFLFIPFALSLLLMPLNQDAWAESGDIALGAKASTLGVGPDLTIGLLDSVNINVAGHWGSIDIDGEGEDIDYDCDFELESGLLALNWYPFGEGLPNVVIDDLKITQIVESVFDLRPAAIIEYLDLLRPIYRDTAAYGHFGRTEDELAWEKTNKADIIREMAGI